MTSTDKPRRRQLGDDEHALWRVVTRSIAPLKRKAHMLLADALAVGQPERGKPKAGAAKRLHPAPARTAPVRKSGGSAALGAAPALALRPDAPVLAPLERRLRQRLGRGIVQIDARIDLHGLTQSEAHIALLRFLQRAQRDGLRHALVITGKGDGAWRDPASGRGVLKRQVPLWLTLPEFRSFVVAVEQANVSHGGEGALYVKVRQARRAT